MSRITVLDVRATALADHRRRRSRGPLIPEHAAVIRRLESHGIVSRSRVREAFLDSQNDGVQRFDSHRVRGSGRGRGRRGGQHRS